MEKYVFFFSNKTIKKVSPDNFRNFFEIAQNFLKIHTDEADDDEEEERVGDVDCDEDEEDEDDADLRRRIAR